MFDLFTANHRQIDMPHLRFALTSVALTALISLSFLQCTSQKVARSDNGAAYDNHTVITEQYTVIEEVSVKCCNGGSLMAGLYCNEKALRKKLNEKKQELGASDIINTKCEIVRNCMETHAIMGRLWECRGTAVKD